MRIVLLISLFLVIRSCFSQDTSVAWIRDIDTSAFKMYYNKKYVPKEFYRVLNVQSVRKLANPADEYSPGCTNPIRGQLHWIARQKNRWVISVTYGGKGVCTKYFFLDKEKGQLNINELNFDLPRRGKTSFGQIAAAVKSGQYAFEEFDPEQYTLEVD